MRWSVGVAIGVAAAMSACATVTVIDEHDDTDGAGAFESGGAAPHPSTSSGDGASVSAATTSGGGAGATSGAGGAGGSGPGEVVVLATGLTQPQAVAVVGEHVYLTEFGFANGDGSLARVAKSGGPLDRVVPFEDGPFGLAVGPGHVYWSVYGPLGDGSLKRLRLADDNVSVLADGLFEPLVVSFGGGALHAAEHKGGRVLAVSPGGEPDVVASDQGFPYAVAHAPGAVVFATQRTLAEPAAVRRVDDGRVSDLYTGLAAVRAIVVEGQDIYFSTDAGEIFRGTTAGAPLVRLALVNDRVYGLTVTDELVYFTGFAQGIVGRVPTSGGDVQIIAADQGLVRGVAVDDEAIYWLREDVEQTDGSGSLVRSTK